MSNYQASRGKPCRSDVLDGLFRIFEDAFAQRKRHLLVRFDLRLPSDHGFADPHEPFGRFIESYIKNRRREQHDPRFLWCREQDPGTGSPPHWHLACLFAANKTEAPTEHLREATRLWGVALRHPEPKGLVHYCTSGDGSCVTGILLNSAKPGFEHDLRDCMYWISYLAKLEGKGNAPMGTREWGCSQSRSGSKPRPLEELLKPVFVPTPF
jgi:hypothetical protein